MADRNDLMSQIAGQLAQQRGRSKYPRPNRAAKGNSAEYYHKLGARFGDNWQAARNMQDAQAVYRQGGAMPAALAKLIEMSGGSTKTTPFVPSQVPAEFEARQARRVASKGTKIDERVGDASMPKPNQTLPKTSGAQPKDKAEVQVANEIATPAFKFKGTKAPMQDDVDLVLNAEGSDRRDAYNAFVAQFGQDTAAALLDGEN